MDKENTAPRKPGIPPPTPSSARRMAMGLKRRSIGMVNQSSAKKKPPTSSTIRPTGPERFNGSINRASSIPVTGRSTIAAVPRYAAATTARSRASATPATSRPTSRAPTPPPVARPPSKLQELEKKLKDEMALHQAVKAELDVVKQQNAFFTQDLTMKTIELSTTKAKLDVCQMQLENLQAQFQTLTQNKEELEQSLKSARDELRQKDLDGRHLLNEVVDLRGQIRVAVRTRPILSKETDAITDHLAYPSPSSIKLDMGGKQMSFEYQKVFGPNFSQKRIFDDVQELIQSVMHGYNVAIIAYGQTGSGKTFTMRGGDDEQEGIIPRAVRSLFNSKNKLQDLDWNLEFTASYYEVYNEELYDLLNKRQKLDIKMGSGTPVVDGAQHVPVTSEDAIIHLLKRADANRSVAATKCNDESSRSHAVFELQVKATNPILGSELQSCLHLVDLAGSERAKESGVEGVQFKEMTAINSGLSNLQHCIRSQLQKCGHIPYRNSKLTMLLMNSLGGGNSKTMVIVTLNPSLAQINETKRSLEFARDMSNTKIGAALKQEK